MTRPPFGFGPADRPEEPEDPDDPFGLAGMLSGMGLSGPEALPQLFQQLMGGSTGPVNWELARQVAGSALSEPEMADDPAVSGDAEVEQAVRLADVWLDAVTTLPAAGGAARAWTRRQWLEETVPSWRGLVDPVAGRVTDAMGTALTQGISGLTGTDGGPEGLPPELAGLLGGLGGSGNPLAGFMKQIGGTVFGAQVGQALGALAGEVLSASEVGLPLGPAGVCALLPANIAAFGEGLEVPADEVRLYVALREAAHQRLFAHVPWLGAHLVDAVDAYARGVDIDPSAIERAVGAIDPSDPESMKDALGSGLFELEPTEAQKAALARLETALALVEGWVDLVVDQAASGTLPHAMQLRETIRRRRATGGPAEQTFATLVGLQLRPRRLREAAELWRLVTDSGGADARDALWAHPDLLPGASDLDDPAAFAAASVTAAPSGTDWDAGLRALDKDLDGELDDDARQGPGGSSSDGPDGEPEDGPAGPGDEPGGDRPAPA